jgi:ubiquinone/menaquinone biosynthesis C-methylase UbiE
MTYYKVKTARELIPNYTDYIKRQIEDSYVAGTPKETLITTAPFKESIPPQKGNNQLFIEKKFSQIDRNKAVLDCACGGGAEIDQLKRMGFNKLTVGVELHPKFIRTAQTVADGVLKCDMHSLCFKDGAFDIISSFHTIEHAYDAAKLLQEFWRVLKPDGQLFVILPYPDSGHEDDFHVAKYELGTNILDQGRSVLNFFVANGFYPTIVERSAGTVKEPLLWLQFRKRLFMRGKPYKPY